MAEETVLRSDRPADLIWEVLVGMKRTGIGVPSWQDKRAEADGTIMRAFLVGAACAAVRRRVFPPLPRVLRLVAVTFQVTVPGIPKPQGRPRAFRAGDKIRMFDPDTSRDWKRTVTFVVAQAAKEVKWYPVDGPVSLHLDFDLPRPKGLPKRVLHHVKRPDVDNCAKAILDAVRGVLYLDDSQIVLLNVTKSYSAEPGVRIGCSTWDNP